MVPEICRRVIESGQAHSWGHGSVDFEESIELIELSKKISGWLTMSGDIFDPFPNPEDYIGQPDCELNIQLHEKKSDIEH